MLAVSLATFLGSKQVWIQHHSTSPAHWPLLGSQQNLHGYIFRRKHHSDQHIGPALNIGFYFPAPLLVMVIALRETRGHTQGHLNNTIPHRK